MKNIKKVLCLILTVLSLTGATTATANNDIVVKIDGRQIDFDVPPLLINDRTMVPLRAIFEAIGATVYWNENTQTVTSVKEGTVIILTINDPQMYVNGSSVTLDSPACVVNNRTLVPIRAISEAFNIGIDWDGTANTVVITTDKTSNTMPAKTYPETDLYYPGTEIPDYTAITGVEAKEVYTPDQKTYIYAYDCIDLIGRTHLADYVCYLLENGWKESNVEEEDVKMRFTLSKGTWLIFVTFTAEYNEVWVTFSK